MPRALCKLFRRLSAPHVFSRLKKEELCLSLAAAHLLEQSGGTFFGPSCVDSEAAQLFAQQMTSKVRRVAPLCGVQEISMLATGATALRCNSTELINVLVETLYCLPVPGVTQKSVSPSAASVYVSTITVVAEAAVQQKCVFSVTLKRLVQRATEVAVVMVTAMAAAANDDRAPPLPAVTKLWNVCPHFFSEPELAELRDKIIRASGAAAKEVGDVLCLVPPPHSLKDAKAHGENNDDGNANANANANANDDADRVHFSREQSERAVYLAVQSDWGSLAVSEVAQLMQLYGHFKLRDPAALEMLEARAISVAQGSSTSAAQMREVIFKYPHAFKECVSAVAARTTGASASEGGGSSSSENALVPQSELSALFTDLLMGKRYSHERVQRVEQAIDMNSVNDVAMLANVVPYQSQDLLAQLQNCDLDALGGKGFCALVRLFVFDITGVFEKTMQHVIETVNWNVLFRSFSVEECLLLADILASPVSREVRARESARLAREEISLHLQRHLLAKMAGSGGSSHSTDGNWACDFATMCRIGARCHASDTDAQLLRLVLSRVTASGVPLSLSDCASLLHLLSATATYDDELLSDVEASVTAAVTKLTTTASSSAAGASLTVAEADEKQEAQQLVRIMRIQADYKAPELYGAMELLVRHVEEARSSCNAHLLLAAGFASLVLENDDAMQRVQDQLAAQMDHELCVAAVKDASALLYRASHVSVELLTRLAARVERGEFSEAMPLLLSSSPDAVFAEEVAQFAVAHLRLQKVDAQMPGLADSVVQYVHTFVRALPPPLFVDLCGCVSAAGGDLTAALIEELPAFVDRLSAEEIGACVYGLSDVADAGQRLAHQLSMERVSTYVVDNISLFWNGPVLCRMLRGFAKFHCLKRSLYHVCARQLKQRSVLFTLDRPSIGLALAAFGAVKYVDKELIDHLSHVYAERADLLSPLDVVESVKALSRMMLMDKTFYVEMGRQVAARAAALPFSAKCDVVHAYSHIGFLHEPMVEKLLLTMEDETSQFPGANAAVDLLTSLWCLHQRLGQEENKTVAATARFIVDHADELDAAHLVKLCSILVDVDWKHVPLLEAVATRATRLHAQNALPPHCCRAVLDTLDVFFIYSSPARRVLSESARGYSKQVPLLSEEEEEVVKQLLAR